MFARIATLLLLATAVMLLAAGCGGDDDKGSDAGTKTDTVEEPAGDDTGTDTNDEATAPDASGEVIELGVDGNKLAFDRTTLTAAAGSITLELDNTSTIVHNIAIEDASGSQLAAGELVGKGETSTITVDLEPGTYTYFCEPHKSAGMTGTLTVS